MSDSEFQEWAVVELFGHRVLYGYATECQIAGAGFVNVKVPAGLSEDEGWQLEQNYGPGAIFSITPTTEEVARKLAVRNKPEPVYRLEWQLRALEAPSRSATYDRCGRCGEYLPLGAECGCDDNLYPAEEGEF